MNPIADAYVNGHDRRTKRGRNRAAPIGGVVSRSRRHPYTGLRFDSTEQNRQTDDWITVTSEAIELTNAHQRLLQLRSRDLARNAPPFIAAINAIVDMVVEPESGVRVQPKVFTDDTMSEMADDVIRQLRQLWNDTAERFDVDQRESAAQFIRTVVREWVEVGEAFVLEELTDVDDRAVPLTWRLIPAERIDHTRTQRERRDPTTGDVIQNRITNGIEFDEDGRRVAYWVTRTDADGLTTVSTAADRIDARLIRHVFHRVRGGQERGLPWLYGATLIVHDLDDLIADELTSAHVATMLTAFIQRRNAGAFGTAQERDSDTNIPVARFEAGAIFDLGEGESVNMIDPSRPSGNFLPFASFILRCIAKTIGLSYERLSGDYSKTNFASGRLGHLAERDTIRRIQSDLIQLFVRPIYRRWVQTAIAAGKIAGVTIAQFMADPIRYMRAKYVAKGFEHHDPLKEGAAVGVRLSLGITTLERECDLLGLDWEDVIRQRGREIEFMKEHGVPLATTGGAQIVAAMTGDGGFSEQDRRPDDEDEDSDDEREDEMGSLSPFERRLVAAIFDQGPTVNGNGNHG